MNQTNEPNKIFQLPKRTGPNSWNVVGSFRVHLEYPGMYDELLFQLHSCSFCLYIDRGLRLVPMIISLHFGEDFVAVVHLDLSFFLQVG